MALRYAKRKNLNRLWYCTFEIYYKLASLQRAVLHNCMYLCSVLPDEYKHPFRFANSKSLSNEAELT